MIRLKLFFYLDDWLCFTEADMNKISQFVTIATKKQQKKTTVREVRWGFSPLSLFYLLVWHWKKWPNSFVKGFVAIPNWWKFFVWSVKYPSKNERYSVAHCGWSEDRYMHRKIHHELGTPITCAFEFRKIRKF